MKMSMITYIALMSLLSCGLDQAIEGSITSVSYSVDMADVNDVFVIYSDVAGQRYYLVSPRCHRPRSRVSHGVPGITLSVGGCAVRTETSGIYIYCDGRIHRVRDSFCDVTNDQCQWQDVELFLHGRALGDVRSYADVCDAVEAR